MRLLFITQKVDKDDDTLGVYHSWIEALAKKVESVSVICLYQGRTELPDNVAVYSLGKEGIKYQVSSIKRILYALRFYRYLWQLRHQHDKVFVHMNPEYVVLGGFLWKILRKKIFFWYNHPMGYWKARLAIALAETVFHTSPFAFAARYKKARQMPVGVDTSLFRPIPSLRATAKQSYKNSILYLGRLSPIKYIDVLIDAAMLLDEQGVDFNLTIAGEPSKASEIPYADSIKKQAEPLVQKRKIIFRSGVPNYKAPELYNSYAISVNMTPTGSFDKTIIEAMACEQLVVASNKSISDALPEFLRFREKNPVDLARALGDALRLSNEQREKTESDLRRYVLGRHDLNTLMDRLSAALNHNND